MILKRCLSCFAMAAALFVFTTTVSAQKDSLPAEDWDVYLSHFKKQPGSVTLNMALKKVAPGAGLPFIIIPNIRFKDCTKQGFPSAREYSNLSKISDSLTALMQRSALSVAAGTFTFMCERMEYYYVSDTTGIRERMKVLFTTYFSNYYYTVEIKADSAWSTYLKFLYPKEETLEIMANQKIISRMQLAGDRLQQSRPVDHHAYFKTEADRNCFIAFLAKKRFSIGAKEPGNDYPGYPLKLTFTQVTSISLSSMSKMTFELKRQAALCYGKYDGWETVIIK